MKHPLLSLPQIMTVRVRVQKNKPFEISSRLETAIVAVLVLNLVTVANSEYL